MIDQREQYKAFNKKCNEALVEIFEKVNLFLVVVVFLLSVEIIFCWAISKA